MSKHELGKPSVGNEIYLTKHEFGRPSVCDEGYLKILLQHYKKHKDDPRDLRLFFSMALEPWHSPLYESFKPNVGHIIYRLSDSVPQEEREVMPVCQSRTGSLTIRGKPWYSLEDWRKEWERNNAPIPEFKKILPLEDMLRLPADALQFDEQIKQLLGKQK